MGLQMTLDGKCDMVPDTWPPELSADYAGVVCEIEYIATVRIVVAGKSLEEIEKAAQYYSPDYGWDGCVDHDVYEVSSGDSPDYVVKDGRITQTDEERIDLAEIPQEVYRAEIQRRAREDYGHLTEPHAEDCALRDLRVAIGSGEWPEGD